MPTNYLLMLYQILLITRCRLLPSPLTLAAQETEQLVTYHIEQSIANLPDLEELRSISRFGLSVITVVFQDDVDIYFARQLINKKLKEAEEKIQKILVHPNFQPVSTGLGRNIPIHPPPQKRFRKQILSNGPAQ